jgi:thiol-disulfide isomerase/thioredoxin/uncharacterized membrane protein YphA (DoxX/SURF4 family)
VGTAVLAARLLLAAVFAVAGVAKLLDRRGTREALQEFGVPPFGLSAGAILLPVAELATAVALVPAPSARWGGVAAFALLLAFIGGIANALRRGRSPDCHCFGQIHSEPAGRSTLFRNGALAAAALLVVVEGPGPSVTAWVSDRTGIELAATVAIIAAAFFGAAALRLWVTNRGLGRKLDRVQAQLDTFPPGMPVGSLAPRFTLPTVDGERVTLEDLLAPGHPLVLVFVSPGCGPCEVFFPELERWQFALAGRVTIAIISSGTPDQNRVAAPAGVAQILLQKDAEVMDGYRVFGTPSTLVVFPDGRIASAPVPGSIISESLIRMVLRQQTQNTLHGRIVELRQPIA